MELDAHRMASRRVAVVLSRGGDVRSHTKRVAGFVAVAVALSALHAIAVRSEDSAERPIETIALDPERGHCGASIKVRLPAFGGTRDDVAVVVSGTRCVVFDVDGDTIQFFFPNEWGTFPAGPVAVRATTAAGVAYVGTYHVIPLTFEAWTQREQEPRNFYADPRILTAKTLSDLSAIIRRAPRSIPADGSGGEVTGLWALVKALCKFHAHHFRISGSRSHIPGDPPTVHRDADGSNEVLEADDGWNHPVIYRSPGPVHTRGWDLWSCGPNGIDEHGAGDDILVGEDVANVTSER